MCKIFRLCAKKIKDRINLDLGGNTTNCSSQRKISRKNLKKNIQNKKWKNSANVDKKVNEVCIKDIKSAYQKNQNRS